VPIKSLQSEFDGKSNLVWADFSYGHYYSSPTPVDIMERITANFTTFQRAAVKNVDPENIFSECPQNYRGFTPCYAAIAFQNLPFLNTSVPWLDPNVEYTIYADYGLEYINVEKHTGDLEKRIMPLQWAIDSVRLLFLLSSSHSVPQCGN
jgi:ATP-binding cassette subfamily A (ABC1) protein 3